MRVVDLSFVGSCAVAALLLGSSARAQSAGAPDVPDRLRIEVGGFRIGANTQLTLSASGGTRPPVDFEALNLPESATRFYVEGFWRPWRRHQFSLSWYRNSRDGDPTSVDREVTWGDRLITVGTAVRTKVSSSYLSGVYRFAAYKNDRFEIGPSLGLGHLSLEAGIAAEASAGGVSIPFDISKTTGSPTGDLGGYFNWWPIGRLLLRGDMRYILVKPQNSEASVTEGRAALLYHPWRNFGVGLQYDYTKFRYDRDLFSRELGGDLRYSGGQLVVAGTF